MAKPSTQQGVLLSNNNNNNENYIVTIIYQCESKKQGLSSTKSHNSQQKLTEKVVKIIEILALEINIQSNTLVNISTIQQKIITSSGKRMY